MPGSMDRLSPSVAGTAGRQRLFVHRMATDRIVHWRTVAMPAIRTKGRPGCREEAVVFFVSGDWGEGAGGLRCVFSKLSITVSLLTMFSHSYT